MEVSRWEWWQAKGWELLGGGRGVIAVEGGQAVELTSRSDAIATSLVSYTLREGDMVSYTRCIPFIPRPLPSFSLHNVHVREPGNQETVICMAVVPLSISIAT